MCLKNWAVFWWIPKRIGFLEKRFAPVRKNSWGLVDVYWKSFSNTFFWNKRRITQFRYHSNLKKGLVEYLPFRTQHFFKTLKICQFYNLPFFISNPAVSSFTLPMLSTAPAFQVFPRLGDDEWNNWKAYDSFWMCQFVQHWGGENPWHQLFNPLFSQCQ